MIDPVSVMSEAPARAIPKSVTLTTPSPSTIAFWGFRSRWITPRWWAKRAARRICVTRSMARTGSSAPSSVTRFFIERPSRYSIAM